MPVVQPGPVELRKALASVPRWKRQGKSIRRTFEFADFKAALRFVNAAGKVAEKLWHHPDIDIRWNRVTLTLTTHDAGGLTQRDFETAAALDRLAP